MIESYAERRNCADQRISDYIWKSGFIPVPSPNDPEIAEELFKEIAPVAVVLTGGNSLVKYGGNAPERDETDKRLIEICIREKVPLYGFCRGMQSILDYYGNDLVNVSGHVAVRHIVSGLQPQVEVNSYHNQACKCLSSAELEVVMTSEDGVIEMIRHKTLPIIGTMWHPEREEPFKCEDIELLRRLINECKREQ